MVDNSAVRWRPAGLVQPYLRSTLALPSFAWFPCRGWLCNSSLTFLYHLELYLPSLVSSWQPKCRQHKCVWAWDNWHRVGRVFSEGRDAKRTKGLKCFVPRTQAFRQNCDQPCQKEVFTLCLGISSPVGDTMAQFFCLTFIILSSCSILLVSLRPVIDQPHLMFRLPLHAAPGHLGARQDEA
jgi:hypothetical protein